MKKARSRWPIYASFEEDRHLMNDDLKTKYESKRVVFWDDTDVKFQYKPSAANEQRLTYSSYYAENCAKGGVFIQPCGWMGTEHLWVGATSDTHYMEHSGILDRQKSFATEDLVRNEELPFINILDKGYRINLAAWRAGRQQVLQPVFARSDRTFTADETIQSAEVASDRSCNERAVKLAKASGYIQRGIAPGGDNSLMDDVWLAWSFQTNFMYKPVL